MAASTDTAPSPSSVPLDLPSTGVSVWTQPDIAALISYLTEHKAEGGDGGNFKATTFCGAMDAVNAIQGGLTVYSHFYTKRLSL